MSYHAGSLHYDVLIIFRTTVSDKLLYPLYRYCIIIHRFHQMFDRLRVIGIPWNLLKVFLRGERTCVGGLGGRSELRHENSSRVGHDDLGRQEGRRWDRGTPSKGYFVGLTGEDFMSRRVREGTQCGRCQRGGRIYRRSQKRYRIFWDTPDRDVFE